MDIQSTIRAFQQNLAGFTFEKAESFPEEFAQKRFLKKFEVPDDARDSERSTTCFTEWLARDAILKDSVGLLHPAWYKARVRLHNALKRSFRMGTIGFTPGSSFEPTRGHNSVEAKFVGSWTCTHENFDLFAELAYGHHAFRIAVKKRFGTFCRRNGLRLPDVHRKLWDRYSADKNPAFSCFRAKLAEVTHVVYGSRFATVPKNNKEDRGINVEPTCNSLSQAAISEGVENILKMEFNIDVAYTQTHHRILVKYARYATIDLKAASDSFAIAFMRWILPPWFFELCDRARSGMVLGLDGDFHVTKKFMCMGNGFCFSLMTLIFACLIRSLDEDSSVFGDDIIIPKCHADTVIDALASVGFVVNREKSFVDGPFRESCGANYHDDFGYLRSFDFRYPQTIADCMTIYNKTVMLKRYPSFERLRSTLVHLIPPVLRGGIKFLNFDELYDRWGRDPEESLLSQAFWAPPVKGALKVLSRDQVLAIKEAHCASDIHLFYTYQYRPKVRSKTSYSLGSYQWAKYFMYLSAGRVSKDVVTGEGEWVRKLFIRINGMALPARTVLDNLSLH